MQFIEDASDVLVHALDHGGVGGELAAHLFPLGFLEVVPRGDFAWRKGGVRWQEPEIEESLVAGLADRVPALSIAGKVFLDESLGSVEGPVGSSVGEVEEEGLVVWSGTEHGQGVVGKVVGHIIVRVGHRLDFSVIFSEDAVGVRGLPLADVEVVHGPRNETVGVIESTIDRPVRALFSDVPFPGKEGAVADGFEDFGQGDTAIIEIALIRARGAIAGIHHAAHSSLVGIEAGEEGCAGRTTAGSIVELTKADSLGGERVENGGFDLPSVAAEVRPAEVIGQDDEHIGFPQRNGSSGNQRKQEDEKAFHAVQGSGPCHDENSKSEAREISG